MKGILIFCGLILASGVAALVWHFVTPRHYGQPFDNVPAVSLKDVSAEPETHQKNELRLEGTIERQCPTTGCWFYISDGQGHNLRIEMSSVITTLPNIVGKRAVVEGYLEKNGQEYELNGKAAEIR